MNLYVAGDYNSATKACEQWPIRTPIVEEYNGSQCGGWGSKRHLAATFAIGF